MRRDVPVSVQDDGIDEIEKRAVENESFPITSIDDGNHAAKIRNIAVPKLLNPKLVVGAINIPTEQNDGISQILRKKLIQSFHKRILKLSSQSS